MTEMLFRTDAYAREATGRVVALTAEGGIVLDRTIFYAAAGGQPGDAGELSWDRGHARIANARKAGDGIALVPEAGSPAPDVGAEVRQTLDWDLRYRHMRVHTGLHLLSVVLPYPVTGGQIGPGKGRLDFALPEPPDDVAALETQLNDLVSRDLPVTEEWISEAELDANPRLVKTLSVQPPRGTGRIRLIRIGEGPACVDLQPCGGTHVAATGEIGRLRIGKIENKGRQNRRVALHLDE